MRHFTVPMAATCCHKLPLRGEVVQAVVFTLLFAACLNGHTDLRVDESMEMQMDGSLNKCMDEYVNGNVKGRTCGHMDGSVKVSTDEIMDASGKIHSTGSMKVKMYV